MGILRTDKVFALSADQYRAAAAPPPGLNPGYSFTGWYDSRAASGAALQPDDPFRPQRDSAMFAGWTRSEANADVETYSYDKKYGLTFADPDGAKTTLKSSAGSVTFAKVGQQYTLTVPDAPGVIIEPGEDETFGGKPYAVSTDDSTDEKTFTFTAGEFTRLYVTKLPVGRHLYLDGKYHARTNSYDASVGTLFGGHRYKIHWYDQYRFYSTGEHTTEAVQYPNFRSNAMWNDQCFVNVAHKGGDIMGHTVHAWVGFKKAGGSIYDFYRFDQTGLNPSPTDEYRKNYRTFYMTSVRSNGYNPGNNLPDYCGLETDGKAVKAITLDLSGFDRSDKFTLGFSVIDNSTDCRGVKFSAYYRIKVDEV